MNTIYAVVIKPGNRKSTRIYDGMSLESVTALLEIDKSRNVIQSYAIVSKSQYDTDYVPIPRPQEDDSKTKWQAEKAKGVDKQIEFLAKRLGLE